MTAFKHWWYATKDDNFVFEDIVVPRDYVIPYGGPDPSFDCPACQKSEFVSRVVQKNKFIRHLCQTAQRCQALCAKQGNDLWTNLHRNHLFAVGYNEAFPVPKCLFYLSKEKVATLWQIFHSSKCEWHMHNIKAQLALTCEITVATQLEDHDWNKYDFVFAMNTGHTMPLVDKPPIPFLLYCHDMWGRGFQEVLTHYQPECLLTPYPTPWIERYDIPEDTVVWHYLPLAGTFYTRPNLGEKALDLLATGTCESALYTPRLAYYNQLEPLKCEYKVEFSRAIGHSSNRWEGPLVRTVQGQKIAYMNKWSEYLGTAKYVTFGPCTEPWASEFFLMKYGECLGSGAIPIMPTIKDLAPVGILPMVHYIPVDVVWENNDAMRYLLNNYSAHKYIAENAVAWYKENADNLIYSRFSDLVQRIKLDNYFCGSDALYWAGQNKPT